MKGVDKMDNEKLTPEEMDFILEKYSRITGKSRLLMDSNEKLKRLVEEYKEKHGEDIPDAEILLDFVPYLLEKIEKIENS
jgi:hypothetical protein